MLLLCADAWLLTVHGGGARRADDEPGVKRQEEAREELNRLPSTAADLSPARAALFQLPPRYALYLTLTHSARFEVSRMANMKALVFGILLVCRNNNV